MISCNGFVLMETQKAVLFAHDWPDKNPVWLPKSQIKIVDYEYSDTIVMPKWLANKHGIRPKPTPLYDMQEMEIKHGNEMQSM